jgi:protein-disulfide isomerase
LERALPLFRRSFLGFFAAAAFAMVLGAVVARAESPSGGTMDEMSLGNPDAKVTVIEYASMTCPHCAAFHRDTFKALKEAYIDTGKVHFIFREFPLDQLAFAASRVARCGGKDRFFPFLSMLFARQSEWASASEPAEELAKMARFAGISRQKFEACLADKVLGDKILSYRLEAVEKYKVNSTPSFVINGTTHAGALSIEEFDKILKDLLPEA